jgi:hypothetical protein
VAETVPSSRRKTDDMTVHNVSPATQPLCVHAMAKFIWNFARSPDALTLEVI